MLKRFSSVLAFLLIAILAHAQARIEYHFPMDGSQYVPATSQIILRLSEPMQLRQADVSVSGNASGDHPGLLTLSDDNRTYLFTPEQPFEDGEQVEVTIASGLQALSGHALSPLSFSFAIMPQAPESTSPFLQPISNERPNKHRYKAESFPPDFPIMSVTTSDHPTPGFLYFSTFDFTQFGKDTGTSGAYRIIMDTAGNPVYAEHAFDSIEFDFQPQPNGQTTFFELPRNVCYAMDSNYTIVDSFRAPAPYTVDFHDIELLTHHHALMLSYFPIKPYDLSAYGGSATATFIGGVIIETDSLHNPVWIWRSWDPGHYLDTDATHDFPSITVGKNAQPFDAVHPNSIQVDTDGDLLLSARELDEVTKISRMDGHIIWRLGGKHNQFQFIGDSIHFSHQHAARRIANGNITLFDNGNFGHAGFRIDSTVDSSSLPWQTSYDTTPFSSFARACEYNVNTDNMTATLAWHYDHDSEVPSLAMGYVQRLDNGNTLINWGYQAIGGIGPIPYPAITEVTPDKKIAFELQVLEPIFLYRVFKFPSAKSNPGVLAPATPYVLSVSPAKAIANNLTLSAPYPNPANGSASVTIVAVAPERLTLTLYDPLGRAVRSYLDGMMNAPQFSLELPTEGLANGAYQLVLRSPSGTESRQLQIVR